MQLATGSNIESTAEKYFRIHAIEENVMGAFRQLSPDLQSLVMDAGTLESARDSSAVLMSRMKKAQQGILELNSQQMIPGDWICPHCKDHKIARNSVCRRCNI